MMTIKLAETKDFEEIVELGLQCWNLHQEKMPDYFRDEYPFDEETLATITSIDNYEVYVAEDTNRKVIGFAIVNFDCGYTHMIFQDICIDEKLRGESLGWFFSDGIFETVKRKHPTLKTWECTIYGFNEVCMNLAKKQGHKLIESIMTYEFPIDNQT